MHEPHTEWTYYIVSKEFAIVASKLAKSYGNVVALDNLTLQIPHGSRCVLLGPNGAGKSTLLNLVLGALKPDSGSIAVCGAPPGRITVRRRTGAMLQISGIPSTLTVLEHLRLFRTYYIDPLPLSDLIACAGLQGLERRSFGSLSSGQQQRLNFALALCGNPDLLILDEPSTSLDVEARVALWDEVEKFTETDRTLVLATHNLEEAERLGDRILIFHQGRIIADASSTQLRSMIGMTEISLQTNANIEAFWKDPQVKRIEKAGIYVRLYVAEAERTVWQLLKLDPELKDLAVKPATLQDAYLHLLAPDLNK